MAAIGELKEKIREKGHNMEDKDFDKIMRTTASKVGLDPKKGEKTKKRTDVLSQIKNTPNPFPKAKKGERGRIGEGRFNRQVQQERDIKSTGGKKGGFQSKPNYDRESNRKNNGFKHGQASKTDRKENHKAVSKGKP